MKLEGDPIPTSTERGPRIRVPIWDHRRAHASRPPLTARHALEARAPTGSLSLSSLIPLRITAHGTPQCNQTLSLSALRCHYPSDLTRPSSAPTTGT